MDLSGEVTDLINLFVISDWIWQDKFPIISIVELILKENAPISPGVLYS